MTGRLDETVAGLVGAILDAAAGSPVAPSRVEAVLPMEFALRPGGGDWTLAARPPEAVQDRRFAKPVGRFSFAVELTQGGRDG